MSNGFNEIIDINQINNELNAINTHLEMFMYTIIGIATVGIFFGIVVSVLLCKIKNNAEKNTAALLNTTRLWCEETRDAHSSDGGLERVSTDLRAVSSA